MAFRMRQSLAILGSPGSGKGFYGRLLAEAWNVPLITTSDVLRSCQQHHQQHSQSNNEDSGKLVDSQFVSDVLLEYLLTRQSSTRTTNKPYLMDGFPRTMQQIQLMEEQWPERLKIHGALHLNVPSTVCEQKILGRRQCVVCDQSVNVADVQYGPWRLPPTYPFETEQCGRCDSGIDWIRRKDDTPAIVKERLKIYHEHEKPILEHYRERDQLFQFSPHLGIKDLDKLRKSTEEWLVHTRGRYWSEHK